MQNNKLTTRQQRLVDLWLNDLRIASLKKKILKEYLEDYELLNWAKKNVKQIAYPNSPILHTVTNAGTLIFTSDSREYDYYLKYENYFQLN